MRIDCKKGMSFEDFKKTFPGLFKGYNPAAKEKAYVMEFEKATGKKHGEIKGASKKGKAVGKELGQAKE